MINSPFGDGTRSWVMMVNGINKYVEEMSNETQENRTDDIGDSTRRLVANARPKQTPRPTSSSPTVILPYHHRKWIDVEPGKFDKSFFEVSKQMTRLLRHSSYSTSRRRRSSRIQNLGSDVSFRIYFFSVMVNLNMAD